MRLPHVDLIGGVEAAKWLGFAKTKLRQLERLAERQGKRSLERIFTTGSGVWIQLVAYAGRRGMITISAASVGGNIANRSTYGEKLLYGGIWGIDANVSITLSVSEEQGAAINAVNTTKAVNALSVSVGNAIALGADRAQAMYTRMLKVAPTLQDNDITDDIKYIIRTVQNANSMLQEHIDAVGNRSVIFTEDPDNPGTALEIKSVPGGTSLQGPLLRLGRWLVRKATPGIFSTALKYQLLDYNYIMNVFDNTPAVVNEVLGIGDTLTLTIPNVGETYAMVATEGGMDFDVGSPTIDWVNDFWTDVATGPQFVGAVTVSSEGVRTYAGYIYTVSKPIPTSQHKIVDLGTKLPPYNGTTVLNAALYFNDGVYLGIPFERSTFLFVAQADRILFGQTTISGQGELGSPWVLNSQKFEEISFDDDGLVVRTETTVNTISVSHSGTIEGFTLISPPNVINDAYLSVKDGLVSPYTLTRYGNNTVSVTGLSWSWDVSTGVISTSGGVSTIPDTADITYVLQGAGSSGEDTGYISTNSSYNTATTFDGVLFEHSLAGSNTRSYIDGNYVNPLTGALEARPDISAVITDVSLSGSVFYDASYSKDLRRWGSYMTGVAKVDTLYTEESLATTTVMIDNEIGVTLNSGSAPITGRLTATPINTALSPFLSTEPTTIFSQDLNENYLFRPNLAPIDLVVISPNSSVVYHNGVQNNTAVAMEDNDAHQIATPTSFSYSLYSPPYSGVSLAWPNIAPGRDGLLLIRRASGWGAANQDWIDKIQASAAQEDIDAAAQEVLAEIIVYYNNFAPDDLIIAMSSTGGSFIVMA